MPDEIDHDQHSDPLRQSGVDLHKMASQLISSVGQFSGHADQGVAFEKDDRRAAVHAARDVVVS